MQRVVRRLGLPAFLVLVVGMLALSTSSLLLAAGYHDQLTGLRHTIYQRCQQRDAYDRASQDTRDALRTWFARHAAQEATNRFIDRKLRRERVAADQRVTRNLDRVLKVGAPTGCKAYR